MQDVSAIGRKFAGFLGLSWAVVFPISLMPAVFQADGMVVVAPQELKRSSRATVSEG